MSQDAFAAAELANAERAKAEAVEAFRRQRDAQRLANPLPPGGLFDEARRNQKELF